MLTQQIPNLALHSIHRLLASAGRGRDLLHGCGLVLFSVLLDDYFLRSAIATTHALGIARSENLSLRSGQCEMRSNGQSCDRSDRLVLETVQRIKYR